MGIDGQPLVDVISRLGVVGAPAVRPDTGRARQTLSGAEDDADWFVVEYERKTGHARCKGKAEARRRNTVNHLA
jgi:hypothetical protein